MMAWRSLAICCSCASSSPCSAFIALRSASVAFCSAARSASAFFTRRGQIVGFEHALEHPVLVRLDRRLRVRDLVLDGVVFLVGLHRHRLLAELRQAALMERELLVDVAAGRLIVGEALFCSGHALPGGVESRVERLFALRLVGELAARAVGGAVEALQGDHAFKIGVHGRDIVQRTGRRYGGHLRR